MSSRAMAHAWKYSRHKGDLLVVLLALADASNDEGLSDVSLEYLARKARLTTAQVEQCLKKLIETGSIRMVGQYRRVVMQGELL